jgi:hypothetical protein
LTTQVGLAGSLVLFASTDSPERQERSMQVRSSSSPARWRWLALAPALCCLSCSGSGGGLQPVQGTVLYKDQPLKGAVVTFHPKAAKNEVTIVRPVGRTEEDGTFTLTTGQKEGAPTGEYIVTVICPELVPSGGKGVISTAPPETQDRFQGAYANQATSGLKVVIKGGVNQLEPFRLK